MLLHDKLWNYKAGYIEMFYTGGSGSSSNLLHTPLYTIFDRKSTLFLTPSIDKWYPFHIPLLEIPLNFCKFTVFKIRRTNHKTRKFLDYFTVIKCICKPFLPFLLTEIPDFLSIEGKARRSAAFSFNQVFLKISLPVSHFEASHANVL